MAKSSSSFKNSIPETIIEVVSIPLLYQEYDDFNSLIFNTILSFYQNKKPYTKVILTTQKIVFHKGLHGVKIIPKELYKLSPDIEVTRSEKYQKLDFFLKKIMKKEALNFYDFSLYNEQGEEVLFLEMMPNGANFAEQIRKAIINAKEERQVKIVQK